MHPEVCDFISDQVYEGRLASHSDTKRQSVTGTAWPTAGAFWVPVVHEGNAQIAAVEVAAIGAAIENLLQGSWTDKNGATRPIGPRSEEHTSELQSLMRISYAVFCLKKKKQHTHTHNQHPI